MPYSIVATEYAELNNVPLATTGWLQTNLMELFKPAITRGGTLVIPGTHGVRSYPRRRDTTRRQIILDIFNTHDPDGVAYTSHVTGWIRNIALLKTATEPVDTGDGTVPLVLHLGAEGDFGADVLILDFDYDEEEGTGVIDIEIPSGELVDTGSV